MRNQVMLMLALMCVVMSAQAKPRTMEQMRQAAAEVLADSESDLNMRKAPQKVMMLQQMGGVAVMGYEDGGFAVVSKDDMYPLVLGYSSSKYDPNTSNENFKWWLGAVQKITSQARTAPLRSIKPDPDRFPERVAPLIRTKWGQDSPYNNYCPHNAPTGCVATATAQVLKFNRWPKQGTGKVYTYYPFGNFEGTKYEADIEGEEYNYELMLNNYMVSGTPDQKAAVAKLHYHVGLAMKAQYASGGTGSYNESLCHGLRTNLGYPFAVTVNREDYTEQEWMDKIFESLSNNIPLIYGGSDETYSGHEFVLNGYDSQGKIHINWGWDGDMDGYFDLASLTLYWGMYDFTLYQNMVLRCVPSRITTETVTVDVTQPGTLADLLTDEQKDTIVSLCVTGQINSSDLKTIRGMAGANSTCHGTFGNLSILDLSGASIVAGGDPYLYLDDKEWVTADNEMPYLAFYKCASLIDVTLPSSLVTYHDGVFAQCNNLERVSLTPGPQSDFTVLGDMVFSKDYTELIECFPWSGSEVSYVIPQGVKKVHDYAFAGRFLYERLMIPESVEEIGKFAFNRCFDLVRTYVCGERPPLMDGSAVDDLDLSLRRLYVPQGMKNVYAGAEGWSKYRKLMVEFDASTSIGQVKGSNRAEDANVYDLDGHLLGKGSLQQNTHQPGVYIVSGKKILRK